MKKILALSFCLTILNWAGAQMKTPVSWTFTSKKISESTYEVHLTATLDRGWHLYSQNSPDDGPVPTEIIFTKNPLLVLAGEAKEDGKLEQKHEELFGVDVKQYSGKVDFVQVVKVKGKTKTALKGSVKFMTCNNQECLPPETKKFSLALN